MQLKETGAGEVTVRLAETAVTIGGTDEEEAAQRMEREALTTTLVTDTQPSPLLPCLVCLVYLASTVVSSADSTQGVGVLPPSH